MSSRILVVITEEDGPAEGLDHTFEDVRGKELGCLNRQQRAYSSPGFPLSHTWNFLLANNTWEELVVEKCGEYVNKM